MKVNVCSLRMDHGQVIAAGGLFALLYACLALVIPLGPIALSTRGLRPGEIAFAASLGALAKITFPLFAGSLADANGRRWILIRTTGMAISLSVGLAFVTSPTALILVYMLYIGMASAQIPQVDVLAYESLGSNTERYAWIRVWGSVGFTSALVIGGWLGLPGQPQFLFLFVASLQIVVLWVVCFCLTQDTRLVQNITRVKGLQLAIEGVAIARKVRLGWFLLATTLSFCGFGIYDTFFALRIQKLGGDDFFVGISIAIGVSAEIILMLLAPKFVARVGGEGAVWLTFCGALAGALRWGVIGSAEQLWLILLVQPLHAFSFGLWFLGVVAHVQGRAPLEAKARLQGAVNAAIGTGGLLGASVGGMVVAGWGFQAAFLMGVCASLAAASIYLSLLFRTQKPSLSLS